MKKKTALITGICGQAGSYMADLLLEKGYRVFGVMRRNATGDLANASHLEGDVDIIEGDITDFSSVFKIIQQTRPHELFSLGAQSHVHTSFQTPVSTFEINTTGPVNILESVRLLGFPTRIYQASTSELWGSSPPPQNEETIMKPQSPYAVAKLAAHWMCNIYRKAYKMYIVCGITHNFESPRRGSKFVTRKITLGVANVLKDPNFKLKLGNLKAKRDWSYCPEMCVGWWKSLQQESPDDYVFASGEMHSVQEFCEEAFGYVGLDWENHVEIDRFFMRPIDVEELCGDYSKARERLGWEPKVKFSQLVRIMVDSDCRLLGLIDAHRTAKDYHVKYGKKM